MIGRIHSIVNPILLEPKKPTTPTSEWTWGGRFCSTVSTRLPDTNEAVP